MELALVIKTDETQELSESPAAHCNINKVISQQVIQWRSPPSWSPPWPAGPVSRCPGVQGWFSKWDRRHNDTTIGDYCSLGAKPTNKKHMKRRKYKEASNDLLLWWDARWLFPWYCQLMEIVSQWFACNQQNTPRRFLWLKTRFIPGMRGQMIASWGRKLGAIFAKYPYWLLL